VTGRARRDQQVARANAAGLVSDLDRHTPNESKRWRVTRILNARIHEYAGFRGDYASYCGAVCLISNAVVHRVLNVNHHDIAGHGHTTNMGNEFRNVGTAYLRASVEETFARGVNTCDVRSPFPQDREIRRRGVRVDYV
jgi:hypothetical protein